MKLKTILIVEDDPNDVMFIEHAFKSIGFTGSFRVCGNGQEAINQLKSGDARTQGAEDKQCLPDLILTDIKMPGAGGFELLRWLRNEAEILLIPVVVLSSSALPRDVRKAFYLGAAGYFTKPRALSDLGNVLRLVVAYWNMGEIPSAIGPEGEPGRLGQRCVEERSG